MKERKNQIKINDVNLSIKQSYYNKSPIEEIFYYLANYYLDLYYENNIVYVYSVR